MTTAMRTKHRFLLALDVYSIWETKTTKGCKLYDLGSKDEYTLSHILDIYNILQKIFKPGDAKMTITYLEERNGFSCFG
jgi:hypothetical protein